MGVLWLGGDCDDALQKRGVKGGLPPLRKGGVGGNPPRKRVGGWEKSICERSIAKRANATHPRAPR